MVIDLVLFVVGLGGLYFGAEWLVGGAVRLAASYGVSSFIVGLTLVSMGTSAPELLVSGIASAEGSGGLAIGNILGSNVANIALILGVSALLVTIRTHKDVIRRDLPIMIAVAALVPVFGWSGDIARWEGAVLLSLFIGYLLALGRAAKSQSAAFVSPLDEAEAETSAESYSPRRDLLLTLAGLIVLAGGAHLLVGSAVSIAGVLGVPDVVIGLTMVAFGTSLPELAASISAAKRAEGDMVLGNIVGSNIFNVTLILGVAALIRPLPFSGSVLRFDAPLVVAFSLILVPMILTGMKIERWEGGALVAGYAGFVLWTAL